MSETLEAMARALFKSWFVDFDPVRETVQTAAADGAPAPGEEPASRLVPSRTEDIPEGWRLGRVADACSAIFSGGTPSTGEARYWNGGVPWLSSGETRQKFIIDTEKTITDAGVENSSTRLARAQSTVIASAGQGNTRGQTSLLTMDSYVNQSVVVLSPNLKVSSPYHLFFDLERRYDEFRRVSDGHSSLGSLTTKLLAGLDMLLPPREVVHAFDGIARPMIERIVLAQRESRTLAALRDTLLPKLISGELRVKTAERLAVQAGV
jgi:type I restriction enzyme S subunit